MKLDDAEMIADVLATVAKELKEAASLIATIGTSSAEYPGVIHRAHEWLKRNGYSNLT